jgi:ornithine carbamoyltransferase
MISEPMRAIKDADLVVTDTYFSMHDDKVHKEKRLKKLKSYQVNNELMEGAKKEAVFLHCLPAHRNVEVTSEVIDGPQSAVFIAAENRLHIQKTIMKWCVQTSM